jgi:hypothetical protein
VPFIDLNAPWFQSYSRAVLENDPNVLRTYVKTALDVISETLNQPDLGEEERKAISVAERELRLIERDKASKFATR